MGWGFLWLMVVLKIPLALLAWIVWWAIRQRPETAGAVERDDDGGAPVAPVRPHPTRPSPPRPRGRDPHGEPAPRAPERVRRRPSPRPVTHR